MAHKKKQTLLGDKVDINLVKQCSKVKLKYARCSEFRKENVRHAEKTTKRLRSPTNLSSCSGQLSCIASDVGFPSFYDV